MMLRSFVLFKHANHGPGGNADYFCMIVKPNFDPHDCSSFSLGILRVINEQEFREKLVSDGFENVRRFQLPEIARQYEEIYEEIVRDRD